MMTRDSALTAKDIARLTAALTQLKRINPYPGCEARIEALRRLVLWPSTEAWNTLHRTALDSHKTLSLWQAVCLTSDIQRLCQSTSTELAIGSLHPTRKRCSLRWNTPSADFRAPLRVLSEGPGTLGVRLAREVIWQVFLERERAV